jgi:FlaA1/EpsC-like NDP-sugar epimerase
MFREQIRQGGPVTVTHPDMQRYFMTIPEASQLVLQAAAMNGNGSVYVLDMGEPVKIVDLAKDLIKLSGLEPYTDIDITYTGIRPGEKLFEELLTAEEGTLTTKHDKIFSAKSPTLPQDLEEKMEALFSAAHAADKNSIYKALDNLIPRSNFEYLNKMKKIKDIKDPVRSSQDISLTSKRENL